MAAPPDEGRDKRVKAILAEIESQRRKAAEAGQHFTLPTDAAQRIGPRSQPLIVWQAWNPTTSPGRSLVCNVGVANPSANGHEGLFVHLFVGTGNIVAVEPASSPGVVTPGIDVRFPQLSLPRYPGISFEAGQTRSLSIGLVVPKAMEPSNYIANLLLFQAVWHDPGRSLDRSLFVFEVR
ncbi:MAG: hypothetical protein M3378_01270 [Actinomycetota bacterium]|nr:hypothetical protein [Actinomycetota bacterium]